MKWNYRVIEFVELDGSPYRQIHEVHYIKDKPTCYQERPAIVMWDAGENVGEDNCAPYVILQMIAEALNKPVLVEADFK